MSVKTSQPFTKKQVRDSFNKAASTYDGFAVLQREVCERLLERLDYIKIQPQRVLDLGAGTGQGTRSLAQRYPQADIIALDLADKMLLKNKTNFLSQQNISLKQKARQFFKAKQACQYVCADAEFLPFADASIDIIFSSLTIQWCTDLAALFYEIRRVLKPGGLLMFTSLGRQTLYELRASWAAVSDKVHVNQFMDMHAVGDVMSQVRLENPVMDNDTIVLNYQSVKQLLLELKAVGAHNQNQGRETALTGKKRLQAMYDAYEQYRNEQGLPLTYEVLYGHAWNPQTPMQLSQSDGTSISLAQLKSTLR